MLLIFLAGTFGLAVGHMAKFAQTVLIMHPKWGSAAHYFVPMYLMKALIAPIICYVALHLIRRFVEPRLGRAATIPRLGIIAAGVVVLLIQTDFTGPFRFVDWAGESSRRNWRIISYLGTQVQNRVLPKGSVIGSWDSGVIGYFSRFPVVNMDGLVNSYDYMQAVKPKWGSGEQFGITHFGITHFANVVYANSAVANRHKNTTLFEGFRYFDDWLGKQRKFQLWPSMPLEALSGNFDKDAWFWEQMAPHWDYESESVSVIVDGNMAQAFFKDYTLAKTRDEPLVFSWFTEKGKQFRVVWRPWKALGEKEKDGRGMLSSFFELPNDVARLVRITTAPAGSVHQGNRFYFGEQALARFGDGLDGLRKARRSQTIVGMSATKASNRLPATSEDS